MTQPIVHFVGSIPLPDTETVFRTLTAATGPHLLRLPDGETGIRKTWIRFLQDVLAQNPAIERADDVPPFKFVQWDGKVIREIPRLRLRPSAVPDPMTFDTGYAEMAIASWSVFERLQRAGIIPAAVKFQVSLPTPIAPVYNNMVPADRPGLLPALTRHLLGEVVAIAAAIPNDRLALQWDVCQEVLAWEGYYEPGPPDPLLPPAGAEEPYRRRLFRPARRPRSSPRDPALSRPHPLRRRGRRRHPPRGRPPPCACRWHRHRMRHGPRRPGASPGPPRCPREGGAT
jgi:hypothetical protein